MNLGSEMEATPGLIGELHFLLYFHLFQIIFIKINFINEFQIHFNRFTFS